jgi:hypothetical protein
VAPVKPFRPPFAAVCASAAAMSMPASLTRMPVWSCDRDHARAGVVEHARADAADVAEALHDHARALDRQA